MSDCIQLSCIFPASIFRKSSIWLTRSNKLSLFFWIISFFSDIESENFSSILEKNGSNPAFSAFFTSFNALLLSPQNMHVFAVTPKFLYKRTNKSTPALSFSFLSSRTPYHLFISDTNLNYKPFHFINHPNYCIHFSA